MRQRVAVDQNADVMIFREENARPRDRLCKQGCVAGIGRSLSGVNHIVPSGSKCKHSLRDDVGIRE